MNSVGMLASLNSPGIVRPDGETILIGEGGVISACAPLPIPADSGKVLTVGEDGVAAWQTPSPTTYPGTIDLLPFRSTELPSGWHFANGDKYPLDSPQGQALNSLSANYKADWGITISGTAPDQAINLPSLFYSDGRGMFLRPSSSPGGAGSPDTIQGHFHGNGYGTRYGGAVGLTNAADNNILLTANTGIASSAWAATDRNIISNNMHGTPRIGSETAPLCIGMTPAIFLGV